MRSRLVFLTALAVFSATGCTSRPATTLPAVTPAASAVRCEIVFVEDAANDSVQVLVPSRSLLVHHQWTPEEADNFHAWSAPAVPGVRTAPPAMLAWLLPSGETAAESALWQEETRTMDWVLPSGDGKTLQLFVNETPGAPPSLLVDVTPIGAPESRVCVARQGRGI